MADRSASAAVLSEIGADQNKPVHLIEVYFDSGTLYLTDAPFPITWNGNTYLADGKFLSFDSIEEDAELRVQETALTLTGCDAAGPTWVALVLAEDYIDRRVVIRKAFLSRGAKYLSLPGTSGNYASTPDSAANSIVGDGDWRAKVAMDDWSPATRHIFVGKRNAQFSYAFYINAGTDKLYLETSADGAATSIASSSAAPSVADGGVLWIRATRVAASGVIKFYTSSDGETWTQLGTDQATTAGAIFDSGDALEVGSYVAGAFAFAGKIYYAELRNGIDGPVVASFDASRANVGDTSLRSEQGETWTINGSAAKIAESVAQSVVVNPIAIFDGRMGRPTIHDDPDTGQCAVTIPASSHFSDFERVIGRRTNDAIQQLHFPGDKFFEFNSEIPGKQIVWGRR